METEGTRHLSGKVASCQEPQNDAAIISEVGYLRPNISPFNMHCANLWQTSKQLFFCDDAVNSHLI